MPKISLFNTKTYYFRTDDPIIACNNLYKIFTQKYLTQQKKNEIVRELNKKREQAENYIKKSEQKLSLIRNRRSLEEIANIIMANLHNIKPNDNQLKVKDLYQDNASITIKLKPRISPQNNAEIFYRKFKIKNLKSTISQKI